MDMFRDFYNFKSKFQEAKHQLKLFVHCLVVATLLTGGSSYASEDPTYLSEGQFLINQLIEILKTEGICTSSVDCRSNGGYALFKPLNHGVRISIYGIKSNLIAAKLLQTCVEYFPTRRLGTEMTVEVFGVSVLERIRQPAFSKSPPKFILKLEKNDVNR